MNKSLKTLLISIAIVILGANIVNAAINIVPNGGTGVGTCTGIVNGNGTAPFNCLSTTGSGNVVLATSPTLVTPTIGDATGTSLTVNTDGVAADTFKLAGRLSVGIPVPYLTPTQNNQNIAFDVFPKGAPGNGFGNSDYGVAWQDICSTDVAADGTNYECLHLGKSASGYGNVSMSQGGTGTVRNLELQAFGGNVGVHTNSPTSLFSVGSSSQFQVNSSGAIVAAAGVSSSGTIAFSGLSTNGFVQTTGGTGTLTSAALTSGQVTTALGFTPGAGTVTSASVVTNQGVSGSVATATTTPAITLSLGALTGVTSFNGLVVTSNTGVITTGTWNGTAIANANLANSAITVNGTAISLGASGTVTAAAGTLTGTTLASGVVTSSLTTVGTIGTGTWQGGVIAGLYGGTGVANSGKTITLGGNLTTSGAFTTTLTNTANSNSTLPAGTTNLATIVPQILGATQNRFTFGGYSNGTAATNSTVASATLYALPFMVNKTSTVTTMESDIETNVVGNAEIGIYADNGNGLPGALVLDAGNFSTNSLGTRTITGLSTVLTPGQYWAAIVYSAAPGVKAFPNNGLIPTLGMAGTINAASTNAAMVTMSQAYGALPSNFSTTPTYATSAPFPIVGLNLQ